MITPRLMSRWEGEKERTAQVEEVAEEDDFAYEEEVRREER